ncbi:MAG: hypothetical protein ACRECH_13810, partial [Nitrososphaerales archaeon]
LEEHTRRVSEKSDELPSGVMRLRPILNSENIFQVSMLFLHGMSCDLCVRLLDIIGFKHAFFIGASSYLE